MRGGIVRGAGPAVLFALLLLQNGVVTSGAMAASGQGEVTPTPPDVPDFWPAVAGDLRRVTWAHAVNSRAELDAALKDDIMMLEADVSIADDGETPIMAHPPSTVSDLTLQDFLNSVVASEKKKGVKLDFKTTAAFERAVPIISAAEARSDLRFPLWLNADIVAGPSGAAQPNVSAPRFLALCIERFPGRTLSVGWTTGDDAAAYTEEHVHAMEEALAAANVTAHQPLTFPVRAAPASRSAQALLPMLQARPVATLTLWGAAQDQIDNEALVELVKEAGYERVYVDLPSPVPGLTPPTDTTTTTAGPPQGGGGGVGAPAPLAWSPLLATALAASLCRF